MSTKFIILKTLLWILITLSFSIFYMTTSSIAHAYTSTTYKLPEHERKKIESFINLTTTPASEPLTAPNSIERARDDFMDAWMERTYATTPAVALEKYKNKVTSEASVKDKMLLKIFERTLTFWEEHGNTETYTSTDAENEDSFFSVFDALSEFNFDDIPIDVKLYAYIIDTSISIQMNWFENSWKVQGKIYHLMNQMDIIDPTIAYEVADAELFLFAMAGDYSRAVSSAIDHVNIGLKTGRGGNNYAVINNVIAALANARAMDDSIFLLDFYENYTQDSNTDMKFTALYAKGIWMNHFVNYNEAVTLLENALKNANSYETQHMVLSELYLAYAGVGKASEAKQIRHQLTKMHDERGTKLHLSDIEDIKHGDYLLSLHSPDGGSLELYQDYIQAHSIREVHRRRRMLNFSLYNINALEKIITEQSLTLKEVNAENNTRLSFTPYIWFTFGCLLFFGILGYLLHLKKLQAVRETYEDTARASRVKGQFLNLIGHNSRTSLSAIESMVQALKNSSVSLEHLPTVQVIGSQASQLGKVITDLIFSARLISGDRKPYPSQFNVFDFKNNMLPTWKKEVGKRKVSVSFDVSHTIPTLLVDKIYLQTAINHLVQEAIHRTRAGKIDISFSMESSMRGPMLLVSVEDTGEGISDEELKIETDIFEFDENGISISDFSQRLGYSIVKSAVTVLGGTLTVNSSQTAGSQVHFCIPVALAPSNTPANDFEVKYTASEKI